MAKSSRLGSNFGNLVTCFIVVSLLQTVFFTLVLLQVEIAEKLVRIAKIEEPSIVILTPYNAQVSEIKDRLRDKKLDQITVTTITKSQGEQSFTESKVATF